MAILKCKMCGGDIEANTEMSVGTCKSCGLTSTIPKAADEKRANLFNRANHYRRQNDFDRARTVFENILNEDNENAEAHWGLALCKYNIEYVVDPDTFERVPACHRLTDVSILEDTDFLAARDYADDVARDEYIIEARRIEAILTDYLEIASKEEPYDIFICYKETDDNNQRTKDSVLAQQIHDELNKRGFKVFFAQKSLAGVPSSGYEPRIYAALNSSKAMVVVGTKQEYFDAVWVKNEWHRFLTLINNGADKHIIPTYSNMEPFELPDELGHIQALNIANMGFLNDLCDSLTTIIPIEDTTSNNAVEEKEVKTTLSSVESLLKRGMLFLEDSEFDKADDYFERVLDADPEESCAYWGKLLARVACKSNEELLNHRKPLKNYDEFKKAIRFSVGERTEEYLRIEQEIEANIQAIYESTEGQYNLGMKYYEGDSIPKDETKAFEYFMRAAEQGFGPAETMVGLYYADNKLIYHNNNLIKRDYKKSFDWFVKAADHGDAAGQYQLGMCYQEGIGVYKDPVKAKKWISEAANQGHGEARSIFYIAAGPSYKISCPVCGKEQMSDRDFCWKCGVKFITL